MFVLVALFLSCQEAQALPTFSRQTGKSCATCHLNYRELTPEGRNFKLMGYSAGDYVIPVSAEAVVSETWIKNTGSSLSPSVSLPKNGSPIIEAGSLFLSGKYFENFGGNIEWTFNAANTNPIYGTQGVQTGTKVGSDSFLDASDVRYAKQFSLGDHKAVFGFTGNNAPGNQDLWITTPVSTFPFRTSSLLNAWGIGLLGPTTMIDGGLTSQVIGEGVYTMIDDTIYAEFSNYENLNVGAKQLNPSTTPNRLRYDFNPYWRLAYNPVKGNNSFLLGTFGLVTSISRDALIPGSASGKYLDTGFDMEYQHITDTHSWSSELTFINERVSWGTLSIGRSHDKQISDLFTFKAKVGYDYSRKVGTYAYGFFSRGTTDNLYWSFNPDPTVINGACNQFNSRLAYCSSNGSPNTSGYGFSVYYEPIPYIHIAIQQTFYLTFLGGSQFVDNSSGLPRNATDNNLTYMYILFSY